MKFSTLDEVDRYLKETYPSLIVEESLSGQVEAIVGDDVFVTLRDKNGDEYTGTMKLEFFTKEGLVENIVFLLTLGKNNGKEFVFINYFYWTKEQIERAEQEAKKLSFFFNNQPKSSDLG